MKFFSSDHHFFHANIIKYCNRPFKDVNAMEKEIIKKHNEVVKEDDEVFFLGDLAWTSNSRTERLESVINKMNGRKHLVLGNHDALKPFKYVDIGFTSVHTSLEVDGYILNHDPCVATGFPNKSYIVGHVHTLYRKCNNTVNVGVDVWNFYPVDIDTIGYWFDAMGPYIPGVVQ
jgi:calcineurin-like phosphoesterase family protein